METEVRRDGNMTRLTACFADGQRVSHRYYYKRVALAEQAILAMLDEERALTHLVAHSCGAPCNCL